MPDKRRLGVFSIIALLVFSGVTISASASGTSPSYQKSDRVPVVPLFVPSSIQAAAKLPGNMKLLTPSQLPTAASGVIMSAKGIDFGESMSVSAVAPAGGLAEGVAPVTVGHMIKTTTSLFGVVRTQVEGEVILPNGETITTSGQGVLVSISGGQVLVSASGGSSASSFFSQSNPIYFKTSTGMNEFTGSPQVSFSNFNALTAAIPGLWLDSSKRRTRSQIYIEILELMKRGPMTPFEIAFYARLNHKRTKEYAEFLKRSGYLETRDEDGRLIYVLTRNGLGFLDRVRSLFEESRPTSEIPNLDISGFPVR